MSKSLLIEKVNISGPLAHMYKIVWEGGGRCPFELDGVFTSKVDAENAIFLFRGRATAGIKTFGASRNE